MDNTKYLEEVEKIIEDNPDVFPSPKIISKINFSNNTLSNNISNEQWEKWQIEWIERISKEKFLLAIKSNELNNTKNNLENKKIEKLTFYINEEIKNCKNFITYSEISRRINLSRSIIKKIIKEEVLDELQIKQIQKFSLENFEKNLSVLNTVSENVKKEKINRKIILIEDIIKKSQDFPSKENIRNKTNWHYYSLSEIPSKKWEEWQINWIKNSSEENFIKNSKKGNIQSVSEKTKKIKEEKQFEIIKKIIKESKENFPSHLEISKKDGMFSTVLIGKYKEQITELQIEWINSISDEIFLENLRKSKFSSMEQDVKDKKDERLFEIVKKLLISQEINGINELRTKLKITKTTLALNKKILEILELNKTLKSSDQIIVSNIGLDHTKRDEWVNGLIEKRMEQLWLFREAYTLAKTIGLDGVNIISFTHESLSEKLKEITGQKTNHIYLDEIEKEKEKINGDVLLLSVVPWLSSKRNAELFMKIANLTEEGKKVMFTYSENYIINLDIMKTLEEIGFNFEKFGAISLIPSDELKGKKKNKIESNSKVCIMQRNSLSSEKIIENLDVLIKINERERFGVDIKNNSEVSYEIDELKKSETFITMYKHEAIITNEIPIIKEIIQNENEFIIEFKSGEIVGFNMNKDKPNVIEIEGKKINENVLLNIKNLLDDTEKNLKIPNEMKNKYKELERKIKNKNVKIDLNNKRLKI
jgi:hypothetical protein